MTDAYKEKAKDVIAEVYSSKVVEWHPLLDSIATALQEAADEALERAALKVEGWFIAADIRALKSTQGEE